MHHRLWGLVASFWLAACGASSSNAILPLGPEIELNPGGSGRWVAPPVEDELEDVSNNGLGYTGEIDRYEMTTPAPGRLQISLSWDHKADFDVIVTSDPEGETRLVTGANTGFEPEYIGLPVASGQLLYIFVAGWDGDPGAYTLETLLLPPGAPPFDLDPDFQIDALTPANGPLVIPFNLELDPDQDLQNRVFVAASGHVAEGKWCVDGFNAVFWPDLQQVALAEGGLLVGSEYTVQFPRAAAGPRALNGEYLSELVGGKIFVGAPVDPDPAEPPRVLGVSPGPGEPWDGRTITVVLSEPLDPDTLTPALFEEGGALLPFSFTLSQERDCDGVLDARIRLELDGPALPGTSVRLVLPATVLGISGEDVSQNALAGPPPEPGGSGFTVDFTVP